MPENVDNFLEHYGVKGMRWGVSRAGSADRSAARASIKKTKAENKAAKKAARRAADQEILDARVRQDKRAGQLSKKAAATYAATTQKGQRAAEDAYKKAEKTYLTGKDAKTAAKLTRGEKVSTGLLLGMGAVSLIGMAALSSTGRSTNYSGGRSMTDIMAEMNNR